MEKIAQLFGEWVNSRLFLLTLTVVTFYGAQWLQSRISWLKVHPIVITSCIIIGVLRGFDVEYESYYEANGILNFMLSVSVVSLGYLMYRNLDQIKEYKLSIIVSTFAGSVIGILSVAGLCYLFGCEDIIRLSILPKSITMPIALSLSESIDGIPAITSLAVIITGVVGSIIGPPILAACGIVDPVARGAALGSASHAVGTARALELGAIEGAVGGAAIGLMGIFTSLTLPLTNTLLQ